MNFGSGNLFDTLEVVSVPGGEPSVALTFSYNSMEILVGSLGPGWTHSYALGVVADGSGYVILREADGRRIVFAESTPGTYLPLDQYSREGSTLQKFTDGSYRLTRKDGTAYNFNASGLLTRITNRAGNALTMGYTGGNLTALTDDYGRETGLGYRGNRLDTVTDPAGRVARLTYDGTGRLQTVTDPAGRTTTYTYDGNDRLYTKSDPLGKTIVYEYDATSGRLVSATDNTTNNAASVEYYPEQNAAVFHQRNGFAKTVVYDPVLDLPVQVTRADNTVVEYGYDNTGRVESIAGPGQYSLGRQHVGNTTYETDGLGQVSIYTYNDFVQLTQFEDPEVDFPWFCRHLIG